MLDEEKTVQQNVSDYDMIPINGQARHVIGYLQDFLFAPDRSRSLVKYLSGGERSRLLLAKLFTKPSNLLVLDEPTNDLDVETLELLESLLVEYQGTVLLVSHDRAFLNGVVTSTLAIEPDGQVREYDGGYDDYLRQRSAQPAPRRSRRRPNATPCRQRPPREKPKKLSFKERKRAGIVAGAHRSTRDRNSAVARGDGRPGVLQARWCGDRPDKYPAGRARVGAGERLWPLGGAGGD